MLSVKGYTLSCGYLRLQSTVRVIVMYSVQVFNKQGLPVRVAIVPSFDYSVSDGINIQGKNKTISSIEYIKQDGSGLAAIELNTDNNYRVIVTPIK